MLPVSSMPCRSLQDKLILQVKVCRLRREPVPCYNPIIMHAKGREQRVYLDWNATAPCLPVVRERLAEVLEQVRGNPSSRHAEGLAARKLLEDARCRIAACIGAAPDEIVFTSGGTEANHLALALSKSVVGATERHWLTSTIEHASLLEPLHAMMAQGAEVTRVGCSGEGRVDPAEFAAALRPETLLSTLMLVNNETGVIQPVREIASSAHHIGALVHTDAVQALGRLPVNVNALEVDAMSLSAHKIGGPAGIGALYVRRGVGVNPLLRGGHQESGRRAGTENVVAAAGFAVAVEWVVVRQASEYQRLSELRRHFESAVCAGLEGVHVNGVNAARVPHTSNLSFDGCRGLDVAACLDAAGFAVSVGSACHAGDRRPSHVLEAMCLTPGRCRGAVRFSFGSQTGADVVPRLLDVLLPGVRRLRG